jgi:hypothetical protein
VRRPGVFLEIPDRELDDRVAAVIEQARPSSSLRTSTRASPAPATAWSSTNITDRRYALRESGVGTCLSGRGEQAG